VGLRFARAPVLGFIYTEARRFAAVLLSKFYPRPPTRKQRKPLARPFQLMSRV